MMNALSYVTTAYFGIARLWIDCGRPRDGVVAITMRATRRRYHLAVRNILRNQQEIKNNKLADAFVTGHSKGYWR